MANVYPVPRESETYGSTHTIKRSNLFFTVPIVIIAILAANLLWDIIRIDLSERTSSSWPFRFIILDASTTATVLAIFVSLFMGRLQWARSLRPIVGFAIDDEGARFKPDSKAWRIWIYNSGPGGAVIDGIDYYVRFTDQPEHDGTENWVPHSIINDQLRSRGLADGADYFIRLNAHGAPFPVVKQYSEGMQLAWFTVQALTKIRILDIRLRYMDSLGDVHEKIVPIMHRMPTVALFAIQNLP